MLSPAKPVSTQLPKGSRVRFTRAALERMREAERARFADREGVVAGYRLGARHPFVDFPRAGRRKEIRLFELDVAQLEVVSKAPKF